ncbi:MAG: acetyl ornithine aminotransferase family protein [Anaerolineae bacterium]
MKDVSAHPNDKVVTHKQARKIVRLDVPGPKARALISRDARVISSSYPRDYGFVMACGRGCEVFDVDGNRFLDFAAGIAVNSTGHCHPYVVQAIKQQLERFIHISSDYYHELWVQLAEKLDEIAPFEEEAMSFMTNSGTEAIEAAIKLARYYTGRHRFIGFLGAFHGRTMGSLAFNGSKVSHRYGFFGTMPDVTHVPFPDPYHPLLVMQPDDEDYGATVVNYIEHVIFPQLVPPQEVAAVLVEPILGEGGYVVPADSFFRNLRALCDRYSILLIVDEVQSGMGRTGEWWAIEHWNVEPDIVCTAKGIASGMPLGAAIARRRLMTWPPGSHGNTYGGNPLACAAALATIEIIENEGLQNAREQGAYALKTLREMAARHPSIGDVRGKGLMIGIELVKDKTTRQPAKELRDRAVHLAFEHGLLVLGCGMSVIRIAPPLIISRAEMIEGLQVLDYVLTKAEEELM